MNVEVPPEHRAARAQAFESQVPLDLFDEEQRSLLREYGAWMDALAAGRIAPITAAQERFVRVASGDADPTTGFELVWRQYATLLKEHAARRRDRIMAAVRNGELSYERLRPVLDDTHRFDFSESDLDEIRRELQRKAPGLTYVRRWV